MHILGFYFDSYGLPPPPSVPAIQNFIKKHCSSLDYNRRQLQQLHSDTCGKFAAMFLVSYFRGVSPQQFIYDFTQNLWQNDFTINNMFKKYV